MNPEEDDWEDEDEEDEAGDWEDEKDEDALEIDNSAYGEY